MRQSTLPALTLRHLTSVVACAVYAFLFAIHASYATLHGGGVATLVDVLGTLALLAKDHKRAGVSLEINISFVAAANAGEELEATGTVLKSGRSIGFTSVEIRRKADGKLIASGRHTKMLPP